MNLKAKLPAAKGDNPKKKINGQKFKLRDDLVPPLTPREDIFCVPAFERSPAPQEGVSDKAGLGILAMVPGGLAGATTAIGLFVFGAVSFATVNDMAFSAGLGADFQVKSGTAGAVLLDQAPEPVSLDLAVSQEKISLDSMPSMPLVGPLAGEDPLVSGEDWRGAGTALWKFLHADSTASALEFVEPEDAVVASMDAYFAGRPEALNRDFAATMKPLKAAGAIDGGKEFIFAVTTPNHPDGYAEKIVRTAEGAYRVNWYLHRQLADGRFSEFAGDESGQGRFYLTLKRRHLFASEQAMDGEGDALAVQLSGTNPNVWIDGFLAP
ncbi:MAG: hypothetical protein KDN22_04345, partial [Verrucomicrobiae bacterium]|nr:hypothetical protein [Verrucomicrobiae bacterium]